MPAKRLYLAQSEDSGSLNKIGPKIFSDMLDCINPEAVHIILVDEVFNPSIQHHHNLGIFRIEVRKWKNVVADGAILNIGLIVGLSYLTRLVIKRRRIERYNLRVVNGLATALQLDVGAGAAGKR